MITLRAPGDETPGYTDNEKIAYAAYCAAYRNIREAFRKTNEQMGGAVRINFPTFKLVVDSALGILCDSDTAAQAMLDSVQAALDGVQKYEQAK